MRSPETRWKLVHRLACVRYAVHGAMALSNGTGGERGRAVPMTGGPRRQTGDEKTYVQAMEPWRRSTSGISVFNLQRLMVFIRDADAHW
jgi:hypothetical protein